jgi:hypothetical protein
MINEFSQIYQGEIFQKTRCIEIENQFMSKMAARMPGLGYTSHHHMDKIWRRWDRTVIHCLVDDFFTCGDHSQPTAQWFDSNTTVITDNWVHVSTNYEIMRVPNSFFGIYAYQPTQADWQPKHRFGFCVNRVDALRARLLCELIDLDQDLVNFNCMAHGVDNSDLVQRRANFAQLQDHVQHPRFEEFVEHMPVKNHDMTLEQVHVQSRLNVVLETYAGRDVVALSEKTFRALQTPAPFVLYAGRGSVAWLESLGFDLQSDQVDHSYDAETEYNTKIKLFCDAALDTVTRPVDLARARRAAENNQNLLKQLRQQWPHDFAQWWPQFSERML